MFPGGPIQQPWEREAAYRKGYAKGLAASEPSRMIAVNVSSNVTLSDTPHAPRRISFNTRQDTPIHDVLSEIHSRLPKIEHPFSITTSESPPRELNLETSGELMEFLEPWDAAFVRLRLNVDDPKFQPAPKKSLGSRLRKALGAGKEGSREQSGAQILSAGAGRTHSQSSAQTAPPPYEETARSVP